MLIVAAGTLLEVALVCHSDEGTGHQLSPQAGLHCSYVQDTASLPLPPGPWATAVLGCLPCSRLLQPLAGTSRC